MTLVCLSSLTEQKKSMPYSPTQQFSRSDALQSQNLSNFQGRLLKSQIVASKGLWVINPTDSKHIFLANGPSCNVSNFVSCNSSNYAFIVSPQAPQRKLIEKQNCPCAIAVVQIISDHSTQHALLSHGQLQLDNYPCPSCLKPHQQTTRTSAKGIICCHWRWVGTSCHRSNMCSHGHKDQRNCPQVHPSTQCTAAAKNTLHVPLESFQILKLVKSQHTGSLLPKFKGFHFLLQRWEEPPLVDFWKRACLAYIAPYLIVQAYYTCNLNPVEIKLLASKVSNGEISGLSSKYHRRTWINKNWVVQTIAFPSGPGWEK